MGDGYDKGKMIGGGIEIEQSVIDGGVVMFGILIRDSNKS